nr:hypothetical protein Iba_scaffold29920CG0010 [Ipomoea batatas]GME05667.1 hypothetical protein Iba_scaffold3143CG0140 [Ipomoea batatas]
MAAATSPARDWAGDYLEPRSKEHRSFVQPRSHKYWRSILRRYIPKSGLQGSERGRASLEGLEELADLEIEGGVVATIGVKGVLGANGAAFKEHPSGIVVRERRLGRRDFRRMG